MVWLTEKRVIEAQMLEIMYRCPYDYWGKIDMVQIKDISHITRH